MRLTALATMKIEGDIIEEFVRHTLRFVDQVIIVDNGSLDAAREILRELSGEGLPVSVWDGEPLPSRTDGWTALARRAFRAYAPDYLLMLDIDEFIRASSRATLENNLAALGGAHALVAWMTYIPTPDDDTSEARILARVRHRLRAESRPFWKVFVHHSFMDHPDTWIGQGNHEVYNPAIPVISSVLPGVALAHIPVRSMQQIQSKALLGWPTLLTMGFTEADEIGYHMRRLNERLLEARQWDADEFFSLAAHYLDDGGAQPELMLDPLPPVERRYEREPPELLQLGMAFTRQIARANAASNARLHEGSPGTMTLVAQLDTNGRPPTNAEPAEIYGEAYFQQYHTGLGLIAYERSAHWLSFFATVADEIVRVFRPATVLDAGCALGLLVESLWDRGVKAEGIDISHYAIAHVRPDMRSYCRQASLTDPIAGNFDLVTCIEVLEHLDRPAAELAIANICTVADTVLFSSTPSDFAEPTHINVCPPIVWIELFAAHGFGPDMLADASFLTPHALVFRKNNSCEPTLLKAYALISRYRTLCSERLEVIAVERNTAHLAKLAQADLETRLAQELRAHADIQAEHQARLAHELQAHTDAQAALTASYAEAHEARRLTEIRVADLESQLERDARAIADAYERTQAQQAERLADRQASAEAEKEASRLHAQIAELHQALHDLQQSRSWRLTRPIRVVGIALRETLKRLRRQRT